MSDLQFRDIYFYVNNIWKYFGLQLTKYNILTDTHNCKASQEQKVKPLTVGKLMDDLTLLTSIMKTKVNAEVFHA